MVPVLNWILNVNILVINSNNLVRLNGFEKLIYSRSYNIKKMYNTVKAKYFKFEFVFATKLNIFV